MNHCHILRICWRLWSARVYTAECGRYVPAVWRDMLSLCLSSSHSWRLIFSTHCYGRFRFCPRAVENHVNMISIPTDAALSNLSVCLICSGEAVCCPRADLCQAMIPVLMKRCVCCLLFMLLMMVSILHYLQKRQEVLHYPHPDRDS